MVDLRPTVVPKDNVVFLDTVRALAEEACTPNTNKNKTGATTLNMEMENTTKQNEQHEWMKWVDFNSMWGTNRNNALAIRAKHKSKLQHVSFECPAGC